MNLPCCSPADESFLLPVAPSVAVLSEHTAGSNKIFAIEIIYHIAATILTDFVKKMDNE